jgi:polyisoprenyl-teichoic acid--peptidoglycan teichoic acid transferase
MPGRHARPGHAAHPSQRTSRYSKSPKTSSGLLRAIFLTLIAVIRPSVPFRAAGRRGWAFTLDALVVGLIGLVLWVVFGRSRIELIALVTRPGALTVVVVATLALAVIWPTLIVAGWLAVRPRSMAPAPRVATTVFVGVLCLLIAAPLAVSARYASVQRGLLASLFRSDDSGVGGKGATPEEVWSGRDRIGVLLLGGDAGADRVGLRTDTVILASIGLRTGDTVLFSLPRNLEDVPFPPGELRNAYPQGFPDLLNAVYQTVERDRPDLLTGRRDRGVTAVKQAVSEVLGVPVDYYALVDLAGFADLVNAVGGVTINVKERLSYGGIRVDGSVGQPKGYIEAGVQEMNGLTALRFARTRDNSSDFERVRRQRCVINSLIDQSNPLTVLTRYQGLARAAQKNISTDIPQRVLPALVELGNRVKNARVRSLPLVPPLIATGNPNYSLIRQKVQEALTAPVSPKPRVTPGPSSKPSARVSASPRPTSVTENLDQVC